MKTSKRLEKVLDTTKVIKSKRQPPNLKTILTNAEFTTKLTSGTYPHTQHEKETDKQIETFFFHFKLNIYFAIYTIRMLPYQTARG